ncbi:hypothetical protein [Chlorobium sp. N1]|uniref:hypothetical protein n=1 Tax=Chlorobium sp. N1 TaxID=2491138 RepID=UPI00103AA271|nr:hypothetical protein [Chlorobium sp. N1]TCD47002.1 hypothetical protein E0L29_10220 [Chlorobium sp. N1]
MSQPGIHRPPLRAAVAPARLPEDGEERSLQKASRMVEQKLLAGRTCIIGRCTHSRRGRLYADVLGMGRVYGNSLEELERAVVEGPLYRV